MKTLSQYYTVKPYELEEEFTRNSFTELTQR